MELPIPPTCRVTIWSKISQDTEEYLSYNVPLIGIHSDVDELCIQRFSNRSGILYYMITVISYLCRCTIESSSSQDSDTPHKTRTG